MADWFGARHDAPVYDDGLEVPVPVGMACWYCGRAFTAADDGFQIPALMDVPKHDPPEWGAANYHRDCLITMILGGPADTVKERYGVGDS